MFVLGLSSFVFLFMCLFECFLFPFAFKKESKHISHHCLNNARCCSRHQDEDKIVAPKVAHVELKTNILPLLRPQIGYRYLLIYPFLGTSIEGFFFFFFCGGFCHTLKWNSQGFTCVPHPNPPSHLPLHPFPLGFPSAPGLSACLMHPTWAGDLFHPR